MTEAKHEDVHEQAGQGAPGTPDIPLLSTLRELLYEKPSQAGWGALWRLLGQEGREATPDECVDEYTSALSYAQAHMESWPAAHRAIRLETAAQWQGKAPPPQLSLARHVTFAFTGAAEDLMAWCASPWCQAIESLHIVRGRTASVDFFPPDAAEALNASPAMSRLKRLKISDMTVSPETLQILTHLRPSSSLERLELLYAGIDEEGARVLASSLFLSALTHLNLCQNNLNGDALAALLNASFVPQLKALLLQNNVITDDGIEALARAPFAHLETLFLGHNRIWSGGLYSLARANQLSTLKHLDLRHISLNRGGSNMLEALSLMPHMKGLERLSLCGATPDVVGFMEFAETAEFPQLTHLDVSDNDFGGQGLRALLRGALCNKVTSLELRGCGLAAAEARVLSRSAILGQLAYLGLSRNNLGAGGMATLLESNAWTGALRSLDLSRVVNANAPPDAGDQLATIVAATSTLDSLIGLRMAGNNIRPAGTLALLQAPHMTGLRRLDLSHNPLGLSTATLDGTPILGHAADALNDATIFAHLEILQIEGVMLDGVALQMLLASPLLERLQHLHVSLVTATEENAIQLLQGPVPPQLVGLRVTFAPEHLTEFIHYGDLIDGGIEEAEHALRLRSDLVFLSQISVRQDTEVVSDH